MTYFAEEVVEHIFSFLGSHSDRNAVALVCKDWCRMERLSRHTVFVGNCYAVTPARAAARFPGMKALCVKGKPHFADFDLLPAGWGAAAGPWIEAVARGCPGLEELRLKRMVVSDENLELLARSLPNFQSLVLLSCEGFSTNGLAAIATHCRCLRVLDLKENEVEDRGPQWLSCFPDSSTSLVTLNFSCLKGEVNAGALERLVTRSPNLKCLRLNRAVSIETLSKILDKAPQLVDLGTGSFILNHRSEASHKLLNIINNCKAISSLSGLWDALSNCLPALYPICANLTGLNLSYAPLIGRHSLIKLIRQSPKLQRLWVLDYITDEGLGVVASTCKDLRELRVFPYDVFSKVTEEGLVSISSGCPKLHSLLYFCHQMTNAALITVAKNCPHFTRFRLCILDPKKPDPETQQPLDEGFGAIVQSCKDLRRLSLSGLLTDRVFLHIGTYAKQLEMLSIAFAGDSDMGMLYVLKGCKKLRKLEIRDCPFGDAAVLMDMEKYETMRSLWMSSCDVTLGGCKALAAKMPRLSVEVINEKDERDEMEEGLSELHKVEKMYVYRTVAGPRTDAPDFVWLL